MQAYKGVDYPQAGFIPLGNMGARPGDEELDPSRLDDWASALGGSAVVSQLLRRWAPDRDPQT